jgi:hypothetical protein
MTCFCSLINTHEVHDAYEKHTRVYFNKRNYHSCHTLDERKSFGALLMNCKFDALLWACLIQREKPSYVTFLQALKLYFLGLTFVLLKFSSWKCTLHYKRLFYLSYFSVSSQTVLLVMNISYWFSMLHRACCFNYFFNIPTISHNMYTSKSTKIQR